MSGMFSELAELREQEQAAPVPKAVQAPAKRRPTPKPAAPATVPVAAAPRPLPEPTPAPPPPVEAAQTTASPIIDLDLAGLPDALFDLAEHPYAQANFLFVTGELERLDDLKLELRRTHGVAATKNAVIRCALHLLFEDYERHKAKSFVVRRLPKRQ